VAAALVVDALQIADQARRSRSPSPSRGRHGAAAAERASPVGRFRPGTPGVSLSAELGSPTATLPPLGSFFCTPDDVVEYESVAEAASAAQRQVQEARTSLRYVYGLLVAERGRRARLESRLSVLTLEMVNARKQTRA
jgi:hypothetical protein